jgi:hypothetical protein
VAEGQDITIDFVNGRSPNGLSATLNIQAAVAKQPTAGFSPGKVTPIGKADSGSITTKAISPPASVKEESEPEPQPEAVDTNEELQLAEAKSTASDEIDNTGEEAPAEEAPKPKSIFSKAS